MAFPALPGRSQGCEDKDATEDTRSSALTLNRFWSFLGSSRHLPAAAFQLRPPEQLQPPPRFSSSRKTISSTWEKGLSDSWFGFGYCDRDLRGQRHTDDVVDALAAQRRHVFGSDCHCFFTRIQASIRSPVGRVLFLVQLEGLICRARGYEEGGAAGDGPPGDGLARVPGTSLSPLCGSEVPPKQTRPQPGHRCHPSRFCFGAGRCLGRSGVRMRT